jgi:hypothetical protein
MPIIFFYNLLHVCVAEVKKQCFCHSRIPRDMFLSVLLTEYPKHECALPLNK